MSGLYCDFDGKNCPIKFEVIKTFLACSFVTFIYDEKIRLSYRWLKFG